MRKGPSRSSPETLSNTRTSVIRRSFIDVVPLRRPSDPAGSSNGRRVDRGGPDQRSEPTGEGLAGRDDIAVAGEELLGHQLDAGVVHIDRPGGPAAKRRQR